MRAVPRVLASLLALSATACAHPRGDRTAVELERDAEHERAVAASAEAHQRVADTTLAIPSGADAENARGAALPQADFAAGRAARAEHSAARDERQARRIRNAADDVCAPLRPADRLPCPMPPGLREPIARGVRVAHVEVAAEVLRLQLACADALEHVERPDDNCPLFAPGATARVVETPAGTALEITAPDDVQAGELRRRAGLPEPPRP